MNYRFLKKAYEQPDLNDFCEYLKQPLLILEDIRERYNDLQIVKKVSNINLDIYHKCDRIIENHLPKMVDNFCDFSFEYRNKNKIKVGDKEFTPKEILLKNLAKVIEEIKIIEKEFNENNIFTTVAHNRVLDSCGNQPEICSETGKVVKNNLELENQFNYEHFIKNESFKKTPKSKIGIIKKQPYIEPIINEEITTSNIVPRILLGLVLISGSLLLYRLYNFEDEQNNIRETYFQNNLTKLHSEIHRLYFYKKNYSGISNQILITDSTIKEPIYTPWGTEVVTYSSSINKPEDAYDLKITMPNTDSSDYKTACALISTLIETPESVLVNNKSIKNENQKMTYDKFLLNCVDNKYYTIDLINK